MVHKLFDGLRVVLAKTTPAKDDLLTFAKTEYGSDWRYAYNYMVNNGGKGPKLGVKW